MKSHKVSGIICIDGQVLKTEFSTMIHKSGYFYARSEAKDGISQIQINVRPFTANMLMRQPIELDSPLIYELRGSNIGHLRFGSDNPDGAWRTWDLSKAIIKATQFANGIILRFEIGTNLGAWTLEGVIDNNTIATVTPVDYWFELFVPIDVLHDFLRSEQEEWFNPDDFLKKYINSLRDSGLKAYTV